MPASQTPINPNTPTPDESSVTPVFSPETREATETEGASEQPTMRGRSTSRYIDYDSHELLEKISQYEDERRWQRIREGIWLSIIAHILFFSALTWIPRYVFHQPQVLDPFDAIKQRKDLTYLDEMPDALKQLQKSKPKLPPLKQSEKIVDKKTLDALKAAENARPKITPPAPRPAESQTQAPPQPQVAQVPQQQQPAPLPPSAAAPTPNPQIALDTPRPSPVPARPNFNLGSQNPADQLRQAMRNSANAGSSGTGMQGGSLNQHSGADGGAEILSDTQGVNFGPYMQRVIRETYRTWDPLIPEEVNPPINKRGEVEIVFTILPNGRLQPHAMLLTGRSGDVALDRAAWGALEGADFPPLPREFHGPYLQLRFRFQYNTR
ncbi:energy transducer TonB family protein [Acidicapsa ligni]|uniref:energy transducer TonB family protein n=1 Tax=Acidicapsa ligni TaxID=542300 RepID=UPI0021DF6AE8|nr:energy transducer TonB [Acidicapsa ligni]